MSAPTKNETKRAQHTPGPWAVVVEEGRPFEPAVMAGPEIYIATCHDAPGDGDRLANARLIAQAPAMYAEIARYRSLVLSQISRTAHSDDPVLQKHNADAEATLARIDAILAAIEGQS